MFCVLDFAKMRVSQVLLVIALLSVTAHGAMKMPKEHHDEMRKPRSGSNLALTLRACR